MTGSAGRTVVVTGHASGIGAAVAWRLSADGWQVVGVDRVLPASGAPAVQHAVDLADPAATTSLARDLRGATALVHCAGLMRTGSLASLDPADGASMWAVHVDALARLATALAPAMPHGGRIVAIGSRTSAGAAGKGLYAATKAAMTALVRSWAIELAPVGITANVVAPAATETPFLGKADRAGVPPRVPPIGRYIQPEEVAAYVAFILSPEAGAITGQELLICGGASL